MPCAHRLPAWGSSSKAGFLLHFTNLQSFRCAPILPQGSSLLLRSQREDFASEKEKLLLL